MPSTPSLSTDLFDYDLPGDLIAQRPAPRRTGSRLLHLVRASARRYHLTFDHFPDLLRENDVLVLNDTMVFPARLTALRETGGTVEILLLEMPAGGAETPCLVRPARRLKNEERVALESGLFLKLRREGGLFTVSGDNITLDEAIRSLGRVPLPPYIRRAEGAPDDEDRLRYQTVFARNPGAVAAPTAGLHFDEAMLRRIADKGVVIGRLTLHVGPGTFLPVRSSFVEEHQMEAESYHIPGETSEMIARTKQAGGRVVAVGTTVVRALESAWDGERVPGGRGRTSLFIHPGFHFEVVDALLTNFHLPRSTLLMLVCAFGGTQRVMEAYREAVADGYRFYSYGDAMLLE